jgi:hypothetical protein
MAVAPAEKPEEPTKEVGQHCLFLFSVGEVEQERSSGLQRLRETVVQTIV